MSLQALYEEHKDQGFLVMNLMGENNDSQPPTQEELGEWADAYGLTFPVLSDPNFGMGYTYVPGGGSLPFLALIDRGMVITATGNYGAVTDHDNEADRKSDV